MTPNNSNCRLLYLIGQLQSGGSERQLFNLLQAMDRERFKPAVAVWNFCEEDTYVRRIRGLGVPLYRFPKTLSKAAKLKALACLVRDLNPGVVHSYSFYTNFAAYCATRATRSVALGSIRSDFHEDKKAAGPWLGRLSGCLPRNQICNSSSAAQNVRLAPSFFVPRALSVIRNGLDMESFRRFPFAQRTQILGVGCLKPIKRWDRLVRAAVALKQNGFDFHVRVVGSGPLRESLNQQVQLLGVPDCVEFVGHSDDIPNLLGDAIFLAHTSNTEGCPNVVMEAMACGRAVVAMDAGDIRCLVEDGKTGFVVSSEDSGAFVKRMATLLNDLDLCRRMGEAGRAKAEKEFGLDRLVAETLAVYRTAGWEG